MTIPRIIIDTDPGQDDAAAILLAMGWQRLEQLELMALTTVAGNIALEKTQKNARIICDWGDFGHLPVYAGAARPLLKASVHAEDVHGASGLSGVPLHEPITPLKMQHAVYFLVETLKNAAPSSLTLCPIGPLTNIALALTLAPDSARCAIKEIVLMGGTYFEAGNITPAAEFNFFVDPIAARIVLQSGVPISIVPLDVTHKACITQKRMDALRALPNQNGKRLAAILQSYERFDIQKFGLEGGPLHDPCAIACAVYPQWFDGKKVYVDIETQTGLTEGAAVVDWHGVTGKSPNARWITDIDADAFFTALTQAIAALP